MFVNILLIITGIALLINGGSLLVNGASSLARRYKISELAIGLTIVAFGTSAPEFVISFVANINSRPEIVLGNVIGSNIFNLLVILGITGLLMPVAVQKNTIRVEIPFSLFAAVLLFLLANFGFLIESKYLLSRLDGIIFLVFFGLFIFYVFKTMKNGESVNDETNSKSYSLFKSLLFIVIGLALLFVGGRIVVYSAVNLALILNLSEKIIALTIVAMGTSLPELVISITAMIKKKGDLAIGNILGSNIFNFLFVLGVSALARPIEYSPIFNKDIYIIMFGTLFLFLAMFTGKKRILDRWEGFILLLLYIGYMVFIVLRS
jgi:cation:H+ antiporter